MSLYIALIIDVSICIIIVDVVILIVEVYNYSSIRINFKLLNRSFTYVQIYV